MKNGGNFEELVAQELVRAGAVIRKTDPPFKVLRHAKAPGQFVGHYEKDGTLDFTGVMDGRHVEFDAKDVKGERFDFSKIRDGQKEWADRVWEEGGKVGWLVRFRAERANDDVIYLINHSVIRFVLLDGKKSVNIKYLAELNQEQQAVRLPPVLFGERLCQAIFRLV